jgi:hypothetical protein
VGAEGDIEAVELPLMAEGWILADPNCGFLGFKSNCDWLGIISF